MCRCICSFLLDTYWEKELLGEMLILSLTPGETTKLLSTAHPYQQFLSYCTLTEPHPVCLFGSLSNLHLKYNSGKAAYKLNRGYKRENHLFGGNKCKFWYVSIMRWAWRHKRKVDAILYHTGRWIWSSQNNKKERRRNSRRKKSGKRESWKMAESRVLGTDWCDSSHPGLPRIFL